MNRLKVVISALLFIITLSSCSSSSKGLSPIQPAIDDSILPDTSVAQNIGNRQVLAIYDGVIDPITGTFKVTPAERELQYHFPLSKYRPDVLKITNYGFTPNFWADIKLSHPFPGSGIDAYDPRVIAILPANPGVRFICPTLGVGGNNAVVMEPDGYTKLFDELGGTILGNVNPFKSYFKFLPYRVWSAFGVTEETQRWQMNLFGFGGNFQFKLVVDVSTNYPNPSQPIVDNAPEPVEMTAR